MKKMTALAAALVTAGLVLAGCSSAAGEDHNDADVAFATRMIPHHAQAIQMADMTIGQDGVSPQLGRLAEQIRNAQKPEIDTMEGWLRQWGEDVPQTGYGTGDEHNHHEGTDSMSGMDMGDGDMPGMMSGDDMAALGKARRAGFERMWLRMMIAHHQGAIEMSRKELEDGRSAAAKALAKDIVAAQQAEIGTLRKLLASARTRG